MTFLQISEKFVGTQMKNGLISQYSYVDIVKSVRVFMKYLHNVTIKGNLTVTKATIQPLTMCKFKHFSCSYMDNSDMCSSGFSCALSVAHIYNSLKYI